MNSSKEAKLNFMDKKFDMMNPDNFSHFNGPIIVWYVAGRTYIIIFL